MRSSHHPVALAGVVAAYGLLATVPAATAAEIQQTIVIPGATCQLSIPTTNTGVRPKATGFRNESTTTGNFVICPLVMPTVRSVNANPLSLGYIVLNSLDGLTHSVNCTGVAGFGGSVFPPKYSTKSIAVPASTSDSIAASWAAADFGQASGDAIYGSAWFTITCNLPPQVQIQTLQGNYYIEIGS